MKKSGKYRNPIKYPKGLARTSAQPGARQNGKIGFYCHRGDGRVLRKEGMDILFFDVSKMFIVAAVAFFSP